MDIGRVINNLADVTLQGPRMAILLCDQLDNFAKELADDDMVMERGEVFAGRLGSQMKAEKVKYQMAI